MLVLSRKPLQEIVLGDQIRITVLQIKGNTVRLGIEAPREVRVVRGELPAKEEELNEVREFTLNFDVNPHSETREVTKRSNHDHRTISPNRSGTPTQGGSPNRASDKPILKLVDEGSRDEKSSELPATGSNRILDFLTQLTKQPR